MNASRQSVELLMAGHDLHHGGEIACLRDLYRVQHQRKANP